MEETFERTQKRDKNKALNAVLYNMLLHHDVVRVQVPFSLPPLLRVLQVLPQQQHHQKMKMNGKRIVWIKKQN